MEEIESTLTTEFESVLTIPLFSYFIVLDNEWNNLFSHSFDFESDDQCETFGFRFTKNNVPKVFELNFIIDLIQKHLKRIATKEIKEDSFFIDLYLPPQYVCLLQMHGLYFIAIYSEPIKKFSSLQKEYIQGSLRGIASAFIAASDPTDINQKKLPDETVESFLNAIPVILFQPSIENKHRNCLFCPPGKFCIPKLLTKIIN